MEPDEDAGYPAELVDTFHYPELVVWDARTIGPIKAALRVEGDAPAAPQRTEVVGNGLLFEEGRLAAFRDSHRRRDLGNVRPLLRVVEPACRSNQSLIPPA